ncbi:unnamed protein product, partial [Rotaria magnacalcarata]
AGLLATTVLLLQMFSPPITDIVEISNSLDDDFPLQIDTLPVKESVAVTSKTTTATTSADSSSSSTINRLVQNLKRSMVIQFEFF